MLPDTIDFEPLQWQSPLPGVRFKAHREGTRQVRLVEFSSEFVEPDWCEKGHVGYVLEGTLEVNFQGRVVVYPQGSGIFIPAVSPPRIKQDPSHPWCAWSSSKMSDPINSFACGSDVLNQNNLAKPVGRTPNPAVERTCAKNRAGRSLLRWYP